MSVARQEDLRFRQWINAVIVVLCLAGGAVATETAADLVPVRLVLVGDSTVASYPKPTADRSSLTGWGQVFEEFFSDRVTVLNHAVSGHSSKSFIREELWRNRVGLSDTVPAPWTPLVVEGSAVKPWGRAYRFDRSVLPTEVVTRKGSVLAASIALLARAAGKPVAWKGEPVEFVTRTPTTVALTGRAEADGLTLTGETTIEYEGMIRVDLVLAPRGERPGRSQSELPLGPESTPNGSKPPVNGVTVDELLLEMPIRPEHARYLYHFPGQWGSVANSGFLPADGWTHAFKPFVWLGDEDRGLAWFCESDEAWSPADPKRALTIQRRDESLMWSTT